MTAQIADMIAIDGEQHLLFTEPLEAYYGNHPRPAFVAPHTANWRGYRGRWEVRDGKLYLVELSATVCTGLPPPLRGTYRVAACESTGGKLKAVGLPYLFPDSTGPVFAAWYTGTLRVPLGAMTGYVHMGYESHYELYLYLTVEKGVVTTRHTLPASPFPPNLPPPPKPGAPE